MSDAQDSQPPWFFDRTLWIVGIAVSFALLAVVALAALASATDLFFLIFTSVLFAIFLNRVSVWIASVSPLSRGWAMSLVVSAILATLLGIVALFGWQIQQKVVEASKHFDKTVQRAEQRLQEYPVVRSAAAKIPLVGHMLDESRKAKSSPAGESDARQVETLPDRSEPSTSRREESGGEFSDGSAEPRGRPASGDLFSRAGTAASAVMTTFSTAFGVGLNLLIVLALTIFLAAEPKLYRDGLIRLFPSPRRQRIREVLDRLERTLFHWLLGRFATMAITGGATGLILWTLGVPLPFLMGVVTALLAFIPNVGGLIAVALATLLALPSGWTTALAVVGLYCGMQLIESYVLTPLIQKRQVSLPPALLIAFQAFMGVVFGFMGLMVASPLLAASMVIVNQLYVKDALGDADAPEMSK